MKKTYDFDERREVGDEGEDLFLARYSPYLRKYDNYDSDFILTDGRRMELKTDTWSMSDIFSAGKKLTPNFFMERYILGKKKTPGGPWQAALKGSTIFVYFYPADGIFFWFDELSGLVRRLNDEIDRRSLSCCRIDNKRYYAEGYKIHRSWLKDIYTQYNFGDESPFK